MATATAGFLGERDYGTVKFKTTEGVERQARMMFLTGRKVAEPDAKAPDRKKEKEQLQRAQREKVPPPPPKFSARASLVEVALQPGERDFFARAIVNRVWNRLFGRGLVMPLDQMHSANPPSHPDLLAWLARDTIDHGYDLRRLIRGLVLSRGYARGSQWESENPPRPTLFAVALVRPLTPMQLACSLRIATADPASLPAGREARRTSKSGLPPWRTAPDRWPAPLVLPEATPRSAWPRPCSSATANASRKEFLSDGDGRLVGRLKQIAEPADQIELAVRNVLSRPPDDEDRRILAGYLSQRTDRPEEACRQLVWALLTCAEFRFNH